MWDRLIVAGALSLAVTGVARADFVQVQSAEARITFFGPTSSDAPNTRTQAVALGDFERFIYDGGSATESSRGDGLVFYSFQPFKEAFQLFVQTRHQTFALPNGAGGNASFNLTFSSDVPLHYTFEAGIVGQPPASFSAIVQPNEATAQFAGNNTWTGTIPQTTNDAGEVEFGQYVASGIIPAGATTTLTVDSVTFASTFGNPPTSDGFLRFNVEPVPLPPAVWPAMGCLVAAIGARGIRRLCGRHA